MNRLRLLALHIPLFVRKFVVDAVETGALAVVGLPLIGDRDALAHSAVAALSGAVISAGRRAAPAAIAWAASQWAAIKAWLQVGDQ